MKKILFSVTIIALLFLSNVILSQTPNSTLNLGILTSFEAFTGAGAVANSGGTVTGDVGTHFGLISGLNPPAYTGNAYNGNTGPGNIVTTQARYDLLRMYIHLNDKFVDFPAFAPAFGAGQTITPGVYSTIGAGSLAGALTLDGGGNPNAFFVIKMNGAFTVGAAATITLTNGTKSCNVFWIINGAISVAAAADLKGTLFSKAGAVGLGAGVLLEGRMFTMSGAITLGIGAIATPPPCVSTIPIFCEADCSPAPSVDVLGSLSNFTLFVSVGNAGNTGISGINGNIGTNAGAITGYTNGIHIGTEQIMNAVTAQAAIDLDTAYNKLMALTATGTGSATYLNETITPGVYAIPTSGALGGTITLDAGGNPNAIFVFRFAGAFNIAAVSKMILANGARRCNIFWISNGALNIGAFCEVKGTFIAHGGACNSGDAVFLSGRQFSTGGAVNTNTAVIYINPECVTSTSLGAPVIVAVAETTAGINGSTGGTTAALTLNDTYNGAPVVIGTAAGNVTLTGVTVPAGLTLNANGTVTIAPNTAAGNYSLTYKICEFGSTINCSSVTSTIVVTAPPVIIAIVDVTAPVNGLTGGTTTALTLNDTYNGAPVVIGTAAGNVTLTGVTVPAGLTLNANGTVTIAPNTAAGNYSLTYKICEFGSTINCSSVTSIIVVSAPPAVASPDLTISIGQPVPVPIVAQLSSIPVTVSNIGAGPTVGTVTVVIQIPSGTLFGTFPVNNNGWTCSTSGIIATCTSTTVISSGTNTAFSVPFIPTAKQVENVLVILPAVVSGGGESIANTGNNTSNIILMPNVTSANLTVNFTSSNTIFTAATSRVFVVNINEIGNVATNGTVVEVFIPYSTGFTYAFNSIQTNVTVVSSEVVNNPDWTSVSNSVGLQLRSNVIIPSGSRSRIAITVTANTAGTTANITTNITPNGGGETNSYNNAASLALSIQN